MSNWLGLVWIWIQCILVELTPNYVIQFGETRLLILWYVGGECNMAGSNEDRGRSRRLGVEDQGWLGISWVLSGRTIGRSGDIVYDPHSTCGGDEERGFSGLTSKSVETICQWFDLKTTVMVSWFGPRNQGLRFGDLGLKITAVVSWFGPQNHVEGGLSVCTSKLMNGWRRCEDMHRHPVARFITKQVGLRFPSFTLKLAEERWQVMHMASSRTWKWSKRRSVRWRRVWRSESQTKLPFIRYNFLFSPQGPSSLLFFTINRTKGLLWEDPSPTLFDLGLYFARCGCASCLREDRREVRDLSNLLKSGRMFW
jgi:hypothetical protein